MRVFNLGQPTNALAAMHRLCGTVPKNISFKPKLSNGMTGVSSASAKLDIIIDGVNIQ
jgi:hypothetical protein